MIIPVILAGGSGTRLWPLSRSGYPKQFLPLNRNGPVDDDLTLLQQTVKRLDGLDYAPSIFLCNEQHRF